VRCLEDNRLLVGRVLVSPVLKVCLAKATVALSLSGKWEGVISMILAEVEWRSAIIWEGSCLCCPGRRRLLPFLAAT
jgi:hypothetical protein